MRHRVYADLNNLDDENRVRLNTRGTVDDLTRQGLTLSDGMEVTLYTEDADEQGRPDALLADAVIRRVDGDGWAAEVDWKSFRHASDEASAMGANGHPAAAAPVIQIT